jgi:phosphatidylglycerol:prolipoprotein diacylglycerol transferase
VRYSDGVARHPTQLYEIAFHLCTGVSFIYMARRGVLFGRLFSVYLVAYGMFRFATEFVRETPKRAAVAGAAPVSGYQVLAVVMVVLGAAFLVKRTAWPPREWEAYRPGLAPAGSGGEP